MSPSNTNGISRKVELSNDKFSLKYSVIKPPTDCPEKSLKLQISGQFLQLRKQSKDSNFEKI